MSSATVCTVCKEQGHGPKKCPQLHDVLKDGFYTGGGGHSHDDDEAVECTIQQPIIRWTNLAYRGSL